MRFLDQATIQVAAGDGGNGCAAFLREKYRPLGGPAGGDGGRGGSVWAQADPGINTLYGYRYRRIRQAERGQDGRGKNMHGHAGADMTLELPVGTVIRDADTGEEIADLTEAGQRVLIARGGDGGRGNARFATSSNQAPRRADPGWPGQQLTLELELRLLADAGLVGLPNAGKSSLLAALSAARPKVGNYPFTTLEPVLGVVAVEDDSTFVLADIPGLVEGAHAGRGLGLEFLRHVSRTAVLVHIVDTSDRDIAQTLADVEVVRSELEASSPELLEKPVLAVVSKSDLPGAAQAAEALRDRLRERNIAVYVVSSATGSGLRELVFAIAGAIKALRRQADRPPDAPQAPGEESHDQGRDKTS
ncbi:MAG: GTPase ObgE [Myxococcales bacterium]|nr:MAG: GTPase ObgE [Myxococcales bacterium]